MKLTCDDKAQIYVLRKQEHSFKKLLKRFGVEVSGHFLDSFFHY